MIRKSKSGKDPIHTLENGTWAYSISNNMTNEEVARALGAKVGKGDASGEPASCFYLRGVLVAARGTDEIVIVFRRYGAIQAKMEKIAITLITLPAAT